MAKIKMEWQSNKFNLFKKGVHARKKWQIILFVVNTYALFTENFGSFEVARFHGIAVATPCKQEVDAVVSGAL